LERSTYYFREKKSKDPFGLKAYAYELARLDEYQVKVYNKLDKKDFFFLTDKNPLKPKEFYSEDEAKDVLIKYDQSSNAPMFVHVQYHEFEDPAGEKYGLHQRQFDLGVTVLTLTKLADPDNPSSQAQKDIYLGQIAVKTDEYIKDLKNLNIKKRISENKIDEKLKPSMGAGAYVDDFKDSKAPQFKGKSKKKKQEMAVAAYLSAKDKKKVAEAIVAKLREGKSEYAKIEKQMFDLKKDGKRNTPEYEKLIKQRAELEKSKK